MRVTLSILVILTLAGAYALGRAGGPAGFVGLGADRAEPHTEPGEDSQPDPSSLAWLRASLEQPDVVERSFRFHAYLQTLSADEVAEASAIIESRSPWLEPDELSNFMLAWADFDAPAAFEWALSRPSPFREQASASALEAWAFRDPAAARRALESVDDAVDRISLKEFFVAGWLRSGQHDGAIEYIMEHPAGTVRQRFTNLLTIELMREGPDAVVRWAEAIPDDAPDAFKTMAFQKAANILASVDPVHAAGWIEPHLGRDYAAEVPAAIGRRWLEIDPPAALTWLASLPPGDANDQALRATLTAWQGAAPEAAEAWVRSSSGAGGGRSAIEVMIARHSSDPPTAIGWARQIADPIDRHRTILRLARAWRRREPEVAKRWIEASELPPQVQSAILSAPTARSRTGGSAAADTDDAVSTN